MAGLGWAGRPGAARRDSSLHLLGDRRSFFEERVFLELEAIKPMLRGDFILHALSLFAEQGGDVFAVFYHSCFGCDKCSMIRSRFLFKSRLVRYS